MWKALCRASEVHFAADVISTFFTDFAFPARKSNFESYSIADFELFFGDCTSDG